MAVLINSRPYGVTRDGISIEEYTLTNVHGTAVSVITFGGIITSFTMVDPTDGPVDIVLGYTNLTQYEACEIFMGSTVGRYANRIANSEFQIDGRKYQVEKNQGDHHLHGGSNGFHKVVWQAGIQQSDKAENSAADEPRAFFGANEVDSGAFKLVLCHVSADGEGGYPGALSVSVEFSLSDRNELIIQFRAETDQPTVVNLTNHSYFNLRGHQHASENGVLDHRLWMPASQYLPIDQYGIPLGETSPVADTPMDFTVAASIGSRIEQDDSQLLVAAGYDHTYVVSGCSGARPPREVARLSDPVSGRHLQVLTTQPGVQLYSANHLQGCTGKAGACYGRRGAICLETQHFPDSPNRPDFPSTVLGPGQVLNEVTVYRLSGEG